MMKKRWQSHSSNARKKAARQSKLKKGLRKLLFIIKLRRASRHTKLQAANDDRADFIPQSCRRRFLFDDQMFKQYTPIKQLFLEDRRPKIDFNAVVDHDIHRTHRYVSEHLVGGLIASAYFRVFIFSLILVNSVLIGLQTDKKLSAEYSFTFFVFDQAVLATFCVEILLKWYYGFWIFWREGWNILDFIIVVSLLLGPQLSFLASSRILRILRVMRAFRSLRSINALASLSCVVQAIIKSIPDMANIVLLLFIILLMFAISGVTLFGTPVPDRFGDLWSALFSLFICVTQDGWVVLYRQLHDVDWSISLMGAIYFCFVITIGAFVFVNLVVAVVVTNLELAMKELVAENIAETDGRAQNVLVREVKWAGTKATDPPPSSPGAGALHVVRIVRFDCFAKSVDLRKQVPLQKAGLPSLTVQNMGNYIFILSALEGNLAEYKNIKEDVQTMYELIRDLNAADADDIHELSRGRSEILATTTVLVSPRPRQ